MKKRIVFLIALAIAAVSVSVLPAMGKTVKSDVFIGITSAGDKHLPAIGMPDFHSDSAPSKEAAEEVRGVIRGDLLFARYFEIKENGPAFDSQKLRATLKEWARAKASYLLVGDIMYADPYFTIKIYVYDLSTKQPVFSKAFKGTKSSLRRLGHIASDQVIQVLTGKRGIADTKIAFANNATRHKEIYMVD